MHASAMGPVDLCLGIGPVRFIESLAFWKVWRTDHDFRVYAAIGYTGSVLSFFPISYAGQHINLCFRLIVICVASFLFLFLPFFYIARANLGLCHSTFGTSVVHLTCCIAALVFGDTHTVIGSWAGFGPLFHFTGVGLLYEGRFLV
ncbi:hypothetical protein QBC45DRAFT_180616 [Copromyces sp. CBS 386.78]|nr:hypothetical protein QBC45DRAFT_180616 [Copromyces sp. CBS 386.78]